MQSVSDAQGAAQQASHGAVAREAELPEQSRSAEPGLSHLAPAAAAVAASGAPADCAAPARPAESGAPTTTAEQHEPNSEPDAMQNRPSHKNADTIETPAEGASRPVNGNAEPHTPGQSSEAPSAHAASSTEQDAPPAAAIAAASASAAGANAGAEPLAAAKSSTFLPLAFRKKRSCEEFTPPVEAEAAVPAHVWHAAPALPDNSGYKARNAGLSKACRVCKELKPLALFHADKRAKDGCYTSCKECWNAYNRTRVQARKAQKL